MANQEKPINTAASPSPFPNWADQPFGLIPTPFLNVSRSSLDGAKLCAQDMAHLHNVILRCLNALYLQAPYLKTDIDKDDFITLTKHFLEFVRWHHQTEELHFFAKVEKAFPDVSMQENMAEHQAFEASFKALQSWAESTTAVTYSGEAAQTHLQEFGQALSPHLNNEIKSLIALKVNDSAKLRRIWEATGREGRKTGPSDVALPMIAGLHDVTYEGGKDSELNMPWFVFFAVDVVMARKFAGAWRFLPCDNRGKPRKLKFGPE